MERLRITNYGLRILKLSVFICVHAVAGWLISSLPVFAQEGANRSAENAKTISIVTAERNIQSESGNFNFILKRSPGDPRTGEREQFLVRITEKVEGGFGGSEPLPVEKATVSASITGTNGTTTAENPPVAAEVNGNYRTSYIFNDAGDYKIVFSVTTEDKRQFSADFPVTVSRAPIRSPFWIGLAVLSLLTLGSLAAVFYAARRRGASEINYKRFAPFAVAAVLIFAFGTFALAYILPPRQIRAVAGIPLNATEETEPNALTAATVVTVPKESQILFGIKTEPVSIRQITSGLFNRRRKRHGQGTDCQRNTFFGSAKRQNFCSGKLRGDSRNTD